MLKRNENSTETFRNVSDEAAATAAFYSDGLRVNSNITSFCSFHVYVFSKLNCLVVSKKPLLPGV